MKNKILKIFLVSLFLVTSFLFIANTTSKTKAADPVPVCGDSYITIVSVSPPKVVPGNNVTISIHNTCTASGASINIYIYPADATTFESDKYRKIQDYLIPASNTRSFDIPIYGTDIGPDGSGEKYKIRVTSKEKNGPTATAGTPIIVMSELTITSYGVVISGPDPASIKQEDLGNFKIKFFGHKNATFSLYVDNESDGLKMSNVKITSDPFEYSYAWDTAGTTPGDHQIIVKIGGTNLIEKFNVKVTSKDDSSTGGGTGGNTFSLSNLNSFNVKNLLKACPANDLNGITCMVDKVILWLLDIGAVISFIMILYASIIYLTSYGEESKAELAKKTLIWSVIGVIVIGAAMAIMRIINNYLG